MANSDLKAKLKDGKLQIIVDKHTLQINILDKTNKVIMKYNPVTYNKYEAIYIEGITVDFKRIRFGA